MVLDVRNIVNPDFDAVDFVNFYAQQGRIVTTNGDYTILLASMAGFYKVKDTEENPGRTQLRVAYVASQ